jgi:mitochondrial chaperone BCS1
MTALVSPDTDHVTAAGTAIGRATGRWASRIATATSVYHLTRQGLQLWRNYQAQRSFTITVEEHDEVYDRVQEWLLDILPDADQRALTARTYVTTGGRLHRRSNDGDMVAPDADVPVSRQIVLAYDGTRAHTVDLDGHQINVAIVEDGASDNPGRSPDGRVSYMYKAHKIVLTAADVAGRQAIVDFLQRIADTLVDGRRPPRIVVASRWGHWGQRRPLPTRTLDSVVLPPGHLDGIMADLRRFLAAEDMYARHGVPWHRGYLFHGPPGTGKTSTFRAIAGTLGLDIYVVSLSDLEADAQLFELVTNVPERAMLLLEDVDIVHAAKTRDDSERQGITLAGLLNALDGMVTPDGLILAMTTNDRSVLDDALLRRGRIDKELEMGYLAVTEFERLVEQLTGHGVVVDGDMWPDNLTASDIVGAAITALPNTRAAADAAIHVVLDKVAGVVIRDQPGWVRVEETRTAVTSPA